MSRSYLILLNIFFINLLVFYPKNKVMKILISCFEDTLRTFQNILPILFLLVHFLIVGLIMDYFLAILVGNENNN